MVGRLRRHRVVPLAGVAPAVGDLGAAVADPAGHFAGPAALAAAVAAPAVAAAVAAAEEDSCRGIGRADRVGRVIGRARCYPVVADDTTAIPCPGCRVVVVEPSSADGRTVAEVARAVAAAALPVAVPAGPARAAEAVVVVDLDRSYSDSDAGDEVVDGTAAVSLAWASGPAFAGPGGRDAAAVGQLGHRARPAPVPACSAAEGAGWAGSSCRVFPREQRPFGSARTDRDHRAACWDRGGTSDIAGAASAADRTFGADDAADAVDALDDAEDDDAFHLCCLSWGRRGRHCW